MPSEVVQPPVAAADLPPLVAEDAPKVPFWKKELSLGGKKGDKPLKKRKQKKAPPEDVQSPVAEANLAPLVDEDARRFRSGKRRSAARSGGRFWRPPAAEHPQARPSFCIF